MSSNTRRPASSRPAWPQTSPRSEESGPGAAASPRIHGVRDRIIVAALDAMTCSGVDRFSMTEVSQAARVSRQTLYRYFPSKEALLDGVIGVYKHRIVSAVRARIEEDSSLDGRLRAISEPQTDPVERRKLEVLLRAEPAFMLRFLGGMSQDLRALLLYAIAPFLERAEREHDVVVDRVLVAETLMRLRMSLMLIPDADRPELSRRMVRALVLGMVEEPSSWATTAASAMAARAG